MTHARTAKQWSGALWCILAIGAAAFEPRADAALYFMMCASVALVALAGFTIIVYWKFWVWMSTANLTATLAYFVVFHTKGGTAIMGACPPFPFAMALPTVLAAWSAGALVGVLISAALATHFRTTSRVCPSCEYPLPAPQPDNQARCPECGKIWSEADLRVQSKQRLYW
ncbi:MAG TPA: hypothetical protein VHN77_01110 [Phycisphaerales bacterium]|nr:hypothetical protein [Phycisphaerales bacterium]